MRLAPIVLFVYNRPAHALQTLEALEANSLAKNSVLYIFADGPKQDADAQTINNIKETRNIIKQKQWCGEVHVIESGTNKGLADAIVEGVTAVINKHERVIVLEDDIVTSPGFLHYMNKALDLYEKEKQVMHIGAFVPKANGWEKLPETYFLRFMSCWGWATWKRAWDCLESDLLSVSERLASRKDFNDFNLGGAINQYWQIEQNINGAIKTWAIKWYAAIFLQNGLCLYPKQSMVQQIGMDGSGVHCGVDVNNVYTVTTINKANIYPIPIAESKKAKNYLTRFYRGINSSSTVPLTYKQKIKKFIKHIVQ